MTAVRFWQPLTGKDASPAITTDRSVWDLAFSPDDVLAFANVDVLQLWDAVTGAGPTIAAEDGSFIQTAFSPGGTLLASATNQGTIALWDPASGAAIDPAWPAHDGEISALAFTPDGRTLVSAGHNDGTIRFWDVSGQQAIIPRVTPTNQQGEVQDAALSPDGSILATAGEDGTIRLWDTKRQLPIGAPLTGHESAVYTVAFGPDGTVLYSAGEDGTIRRWEVNSRQPLGEPIEAGQGVILMLAISPDGTTLASGGSDGSIRLWHVAPQHALFAKLGGLSGSPPPWPIAQMGRLWRQPMQMARSCPGTWRLAPRSASPCTGTPIFSGLSRSARTGKHSRRSVLTARGASGAQ